MLKLKGQDNKLHSPSDIAVKHEGILRHVYVVKMKVNGVLYTIWQKIKEIIFGGVKVQDHVVKIQGKSITLKGQNTNGTN